MEYIWFPLVVASILGFVGFRQWLRHQQRAMVHRERLAALEKGAELPPWPTDPVSTGPGLDIVLLLSGLIWLAVGIGGMIATYSILPLLEVPEKPPANIALIGLPVALIGVAHLITYTVYRRGRR
jgi:hypothetical protein